MKKKYDVIWSNVAEKDLVDIIEYISADSPSIALKVFKNIKQKASNLYSFPERGRVVPGLLDQGIAQYRELVISHWRVIYRISERAVYVLSVLDARQNAEDLLLRRLTK
jgi:plasmid stabilization system protein ParE